MEPADLALDCDFRSLLACVRRGDEKAAAELVDRYEPELRRYIRLRLTNPRLRRYLDNDDICQSVLGRLFAGLLAGRFELRSASQLVALLTKMAKNEVCDCVRRQNSSRRGGPQRRDVPVQTCSNLQFVESSVAEQIANREVVGMILQELPSHERCLAHRRMEGLGWTELAAEFRTSAEVLRKRFRRATSRVVARLRLHDFIAN
jgi:RNA polymerase sigma-70 factor (ECF subfamily)